MKTSSIILFTLFVVSWILYVTGFFHFVLKPLESTTADYSLGNCSFITNPDKIMICFDFNQDGKSMGAYAGSTMPTIFLRTIESDTVEHEILHHLLTRDTTLTTDQQHKFIEDFEIIQKEIFKVYYK